MKITSSDMLAQALKSSRKHQNLSQQATADQIGVKQATVSSFENHPDKSKVETLFKLLSALDLELSLTRRGEPEQASGWDQEW